MATSSLTDQGLGNLTNLTATEVYANETMASKHISSNIDVTQTTAHLHRMVVVAIMSILLFISLSVSVAIFVFCRKKNSVFILQKSEQNIDADYEMDDMPTEIEGSESETEYPMIDDHMRSQSYPNMSRLSEYTKNSMINLPFSAKQSKRTASYQILPKSKSYDEQQSSNSEHEIVPTKSERSTPEGLPVGNHHDFSKCLPFPKTLSKSSLSFNYQSMTVTAEVEKWSDVGSFECLNFESDSSKCLNYKSNFESDSLKCLNFKSGSSESLLSSMSKNEESYSDIRKNINGLELTFEPSTNEGSYENFPLMRFYEKQQVQGNFVHNRRNHNEVIDTTDALVEKSPRCELVHEYCNKFPADNNSPLCRTNHHNKSGQSIALDCNQQSLSRSSVDDNSTQTTPRCATRLSKQIATRFDSNEMLKPSNDYSNGENPTVHRNTNEETSRKHDNLFCFGDDFNGLLNVYQRTNSNLSSTQRKQNANDIPVQNS